MAALLQAFVLAVGLLMAVVGPAAAEPCHHTPAFAITISDPRAHDAANHAPAAACPSGMAGCWSHCQQITSIAFITAPAAAVPRPPFIRDIAGRAQDGPTRHLPPPKLLS